MDIFLSILSIICVLLGVIGCIVPILPGPPIAFVGLLLANWTSYTDFSTEWMVVWGAITIAVTIIDYYLPVWFTKKLGGSKQATRGATLGIIVGMFFMPLGVILGPFIGAFIGEMFHNREDNAKAFKVAFGSFVAFISGTGMKLAAACMMAFHVIKGIFF